MVEGWGRMSYTDMYAGVAAMSALGLVVYVALDWLEKRACPWETAREAQRLPGVAS
jgi:NitT/TauT family transport system permease protein